MRKGADHPIPNKIGPFILTEELGRGSYSIVRLAIDESSKDVFACKVIPKSLLSMNSSEWLFKNELSIQRSIDHPNCVKIHEFFCDSINYYVIMDYCPNKTLGDFIKGSADIAEGTVASVFSQVMDAVCFLHRNRIAHRDLKPENILFGTSNSVKLTDFGFAILCDSKGLVKGKYGTVSFCAPEVLEGQEYDPFKADIWSCGIILFTMLFGRVPWTVSSSKQIEAQVISSQFFIPATVSSDAYDLLTKMLQHDFDKRITAEEVLRHPFLVSAGVSGIESEGSVSKFDISMNDGWENSDDWSSSSSAQSEGRTLLKMSRSLKRK